LYFYNNYPYRIANNYIVSFRIDTYRIVWWPYRLIPIKKLDYNRCSQLTLWCRGNASALGGRGTGFNSWPWQWFLCLNVFLLLLLCFFYCFWSKNTLFVTKCCNFFCNVNLFSILNIRFVTDYYGIKIQT